MLSYNITTGNLEAIVHSYKASFLRPDEYNTLTQCASLGDMKSQLQVTDYGNFLGNESALTGRIIADRATEVVVAQFRELREGADRALGKFLDFISYEYMLSNVLKLIAATRNGRDSLEILSRMHPLGLFPGIASLAAATSVEEMMDTVLVDSPIGRFFQTSQMKDLDELSFEFVRAVLQKNYIEAFYDYCESLGGETATWMCSVLEFEADRLVMTIAANTAGMHDLSPDDRRKMFPSIGSLASAHDELSSVDSIEQLAERLKFCGFHDWAELLGDGARTGEKSGGFEKRLVERAVGVYKTLMTRQFQYGVFYGWMKLKELEVQNLIWISECVMQGIKDSVHDYVHI
jgi:V-type H+-transporting ATPase subunit d